MKVVNEYNIDEGYDLNFNQVSKCLLLTALLLLSACGVDESESNVSKSKSKSQTQQVTLSADNTIDSITNGLESYISLEDKIHASSSVGYNTVSEVVLLSAQPACRDINVYPSGYSVNSTGYIGTCVYEYTVENTIDSTARAVAYSTTIVQDDVTGSVEQFEAIAETEEANQPLSINLSEKLLGQIPDGYSLSSTMTNLGVGSASLDINNQTITFISDEPGYSQIIYSYASETEVKIGSINIAVSVELNTAPIAPDIDYSADMSTETVNINTEVIINLGPYISDPDGEPLQLIYVDSWYASVVPFDLSDENNTKFTFNTVRAGEHFVTYAISDHNGGYDIGQIRIEVYDPESAASWGNIQQGLQLFYGPLTHAEAFGQGVMDTSTNFDQNRTVSTFHYADAKNSCKSKGGLPSEVQLQELYYLNKPESQGWPVVLNYWSNNVNTVVSLSSGQVSSPVGTNTYYVTCVNEAGFSIDSRQSFTDNVIANGGSTDDGIAKVVVKFTFDQQPVSGAVINASVPDMTFAQLDMSSVTTDDDGIAIFKVTDIKAETVAFTAEYNGVQRTIEITFIGDKSTAELVSEVVINNTDISGGINEVVATLKDSNDNPLKGEPISFASSDTVNISSGTGGSTTDDNGQQSALVQWTGALDLNFDPTATITSSYTRVDTVELLSDSLVTFSTAKLTGLIIDKNNQPFDGGTNLVHAVVKKSDGSLAAGKVVRFTTNSAYCKINGFQAAEGNYVDVTTGADGFAYVNISFSTSSDIDISCTVTAEMGPVSKKVTVKFLSHHYVCGNKINDTDKDNASGTCVKVASANGKLFAGAPSMPFLNSVGHTNTGGTYTENGTTGPLGVFATIFKGSISSLCVMYNTIGLDSKSNWRAASTDELVELYGVHGNMYDAMGWATHYSYWSSTPNDNYYDHVSLRTGEVFDFIPGYYIYFTCVSGD